MAKFHLKIVSQERQLVDEEAHSITVPTTEGEITVLPRHVPLFAGLQAGLVRYIDSQNNPRVFVITKGFINVDPHDSVTIMTDSAVSEREISAQEAQQAIDLANQKIKKASANAEDLMRAEAELRYALLQLKVAQQTRKTAV